MRVSAVIRLSLALACVLSVSAGAQDLHAISSGGFAAAYKALEPQFEKQSGLHVETAWGPSMGATPGAIPNRLTNKEPGDVVILARPDLDALAKRGLVVEGSQVDLAYSKIGLAVKAGAPIPDISTDEGLRKTLLAAKSIAYSDSASGVYVAAQLFKTLGIENEVAGKAHQIPATPVGEIVARGEAEIGFQQISELKPIAGVTLVGPIPADVQKVTTFSAGVVAYSKEKAKAKDLIEFLSSKGSCSTVEASGMEPVACSLKK